MKVPKPDNVYKHGLPFSETLKKSIDEIVDRIFKYNKAGMIVIDGGVGEGKTTLATHIADYVNKGPINFEVQLSMGGGDFQTKLRLCFSENLIVIIYDEAGDFSRRAALTMFNRTLLRVFQIYRAFKILVILTLPDFSDLDNNLMKMKVPRFLIHCYPRGKRQGNFYGYSLWRMFYLKKKMEKLTVTADAYKFVDPNIHGHFKDLPPKRRQELHNVTIKGKLEISEADLSGKDLYTIKDLTILCDRSLNWVQKHITEQGIKPKKTIKNAHYYEPKVEKILLSLKRTK